MAPIVRSIIQEGDYFKRPAFGRRGNNRYWTIPAGRFERDWNAPERKIRVNGIDAANGCERAREAKRVGAEASRVVLNQSRQFGEGR
ncbi:hypothetical protein [Burkholderia pseudomallei]|nr:hypothetical protein [Burkholderia pseudomallei]MDV2112329.1 hypothetical protein [Burkholderia pseudomallei]